MPIFKSSKHARLRRYGLLLLFGLVLYFVWPTEHIETISNTLVTDQRKNDYLDAILNPKDAKSSAEGIYGSDGPVKAIFNPEANDLDATDVINPEKMKMAMDKLKLGQEDEEVEGNILSNFVLKSKYLVMDPLVSYVGNKVSQMKDYYGELTCHDIKYTPQSDLEYTEPIRLEDDFFDIRDMLLSTKYQKLISVIDDSNPDGSIVSDIKNWYKKSGSSVWLPREKLHMVATTVMYAPFDIFNPLASFIRLQLFDSNWNEVKGRRIKFNDLADKDIHNALKKYNKSKKDEDLDAISIKFPSILNIPIETKNIKRSIGPENPRMIYKKGEVFSEPIIIFNMAVSKDKRNMFSILPFRKPYGTNNEHKILKFKNIGNNALIQLKDEKNWVPFFDTIRVGDSKTSRGNIHFMYTSDPLVIFRCSLDSGHCSKLQDNIKSSSQSMKSLGYLRGGTSYYPVPRDIIEYMTPDSSKIQMWIGFQRVNLKKSACGAKFNRPALTVLVKEDGIFRLDMISSPLDFNMNVGAICDFDSPSIINANGISFWEITRNENSAWEDNMGIIIDTQSENVSLIFLRNVLSYITGIYPGGKNLSMKDFDKDEASHNGRSRKVAECALGSALDYAEDLSKKKAVKIMD